MKLNISNPLNNVQKSIEIDDEKKLLPFFEKRIGNEVPANSIGEEFNGYVFRITGGNDKQGFPMMQGVLANHRVRLLFKKGMKCYRPRRTGERKRKSVRGCIVGQDLSALNLVLVKKGEKEIPGLTDKTVGKKLGPKRANKIRKLFNLDKNDDVRKYAIGRIIKKGNKTRIVKPKIQRLVTENRLIRKKRLIEAKKRRRIEKSKALKAYRDILKKYRSEVENRKSEETGKKKKVRKSISKGIQKRVDRKKAAASKKEKGETVEKKEKKEKVPKSSKDKTPKTEKKDNKKTPKETKGKNKGDKKKTQK